MRVAIRRESGLSRRRRRADSPGLEEFVEYQQLSAGSQHSCGFEQA